MRWLSCTRYLQIHTMLYCYIIHEERVFTYLKPRCAVCESTYILYLLTFICLSNQIDMHKKRMTLWHWNGHHFVVFATKPFCKTKKKSVFLLPMSAAAALFCRHMEIHHSARTMMKIIWRVLQIVSMCVFGMGNETFFNWMGEFRWGAIELMKKKKTFVYLVLLKPAFFI